jgi:20S proteasome subunit alpha 7
MIEPSGVSWGYFGATAGKAATAAKTEIEKLKLTEMTAREAIVEAAKMYGFLLASGSRQY